MPKKRGRRTARLSRHESTRPARHAPPTDHLPGSTAKLEELARRCEARQSLFGPGDMADMEGLMLRLKKARNNYLLPDRDNPEGDIIDEAGKTPENNSTKKFKRLSGATPGDRIRAARLKCGLSATQASLLMGLSQSMLGKVERREVAPCLWTIYLASEHLRVDPDWLACLESDEGGNVRCLCQ